MPSPERTFLLASRYQVASELAFYVAGHPPTYNINLGRRLNQYDFWEGPESRLGWDGIYVEDGVPGAPDARVQGAFERVGAPLVVEVTRRGRMVRQFTMFRCYRFRGLPPPSTPAGY
jgi:hypothetical protein